MADAALGCGVPVLMAVTVTRAPTGALPGHEPRATSVDAELDFLDALLDALDLTYGALVADDRRREAHAWRPSRPCRCDHRWLFEPRHCSCCGRDVEAVVA